MPNRGPTRSSRNVRLLEIREPWDDKDEVQRNLNDTNYNRMWEYNNRGIGSKVVAEPKQ
ncbi:acyl-CoA thioester hydrolase YbgC [Salmonella enterica subsp. enterica]|nr:acyl-CoA thioester hydrolase YbgC [Salmonella enterica subsp. enterica]